jgi:sugar lactone lactonase YvrE
MILFNGISMINFELLSNSRAELGEGISITQSKNQIMWVDILGNRVFTKNLGTEKEQVFTKFLHPSCTFPDGENGFFISHSNGISWVDFQGRNLQHCVSWFSSDSGLRCNDGTMDGNGNIWISTMSTEQLKNKGTIWFWNRKSKPIKIIDNLTIPNSIAVDHERKRLYFADSLDHSIYFLDIKSEGHMGSLNDFYTSSLGVPDGSTLDSEGNLWNTRWDGSSIIKITPDGNLDLKISVPFARPTSCIFGKSTNQLYVTSATFPDDKNSGYSVSLLID